jgi:hypothetical protein
MPKWLSYTLTDASLAIFISSLKISAKKSTNENLFLTIHRPTKATVKERDEGEIINTIILNTATIKARALAVLKRVTDHLTIIIVTWSKNTEPKAKAKAKAKEKGKANKDNTAIFPLNHVRHAATVAFLTTIHANAEKDSRIWTLPINLSPTTVKILIST